MISIIVPIHNQISMNKIFLTYLRKYTDAAYELIIVDNNSTDGSAEYFERQGATVIRNKKNMCYACSMNLGVRYARSDILVLANNDVIVSPNWASKLLNILRSQNLDMVSPVGIEVLGKNLKRRWKLIRVLFGLGILPYVTKFQIMGSFKVMYGNWEHYCKRYDRQNLIKSGISGNFVMVRKDKFLEVGGFDPEIAAADWDIFMTFAQKHFEGEDFKLPMLVMNVYIHHFIRLTARSPHRFECSHNFKKLKEKWNPEDIEKYWHYPQNQLWKRYYDEKV